MNTEPDLMLDVCDGYTAGIGTLTRLAGETVTQGPVTALFSGLPVPPFNAIHAWRPDAGVDRAVLELVGIGGDRGLPLSICVPVGADHESGIEALATDLGFAEPGASQALMVLEGGPIPPLPDGLVSSSPQSAEDLSVVAELTTANVYNVGVPDRHRRQGLGAAATWEAVRRGRERGAPRTALVASSMGEPVYARMGFEEVGRIRTFMRA